MRMQVEPRFCYGLWCINLAMLDPLQYPLFSARKREEGNVWTVHVGLASVPMIVGCIFIQPFPS